MEMNETSFRIRPYSKRELAELYFPETGNARSAVANLRNLLHRNPELIRELGEASYKSRDKMFTPKQVSILVRYLGEP